MYKTLNNMFPLELTVIHKHNLNMECEMNTKLWHQRFGYLNAKSLKLLKNIDMVHGMPIVQQMQVCGDCAFGKQTVKPFPVHCAWRATKCLELVHTDLLGTMQTESLGGSKCFILLTNDFNRMSWVFFLSKSNLKFLIVSRSLNYGKKTIRVLIEGSQVRQGR